MESQASEPGGKAEEVPADECWRLECSANCTSEPPPRNANLGVKTGHDATEGGVDRRLTSAERDGAREEERGQKSQESLDRERNQPGGRELHGEDRGNGEAKRAPVRTTRAAEVSGFVGVLRSGFGR